MISLDGIMINMDKIESINNIVLLLNKRAMQSFFGKINFVRIFISNFVETVKPLQEMIKKDEN